MAKPRCRGLALLLAITAFVASAQEELSCPDEQDLLATRIVQCFNHGLLKRQETGLAPLLSVPGAPLAVDSQLLESCLAAAGQGIKVITGLSDEGGQTVTEIMMRQFEADSGLQVAMTYKKVEEIYPELKFAVLQHVSGVYNVFVGSSDMIHELNSIGLYQDLTPYMDKDAAYTKIWNEIHPFFRENHAEVVGKAGEAKKRVSIPFGVNSLPYMYWRTDVFKRYNLSVPETWEEVIEVVRFLNQTDWDTRVNKKIPICFLKPLTRDMGAPNKGHYLLTSILGSMTQYQGKVHGLLIDPLTMKPLMNSTAMARALELYAQLASFMPDELPDGGPDSDGRQTILVNGYCALGFRWTEQFKMSGFSMYIKGNLGTAIMPGSTRVWDRADNTMMDCTPDLCLGSDAIVRRDHVTGKNVTLYVNRVSYSGTPGYSASINAYSSRGYQEAAYRALSFLGNGIFGNVGYMYIPLVLIGPMKSNQLTLDPASLAMWPKSYNQSDVRSYVSATIRVMAHPNTLTDLKMPSQASIKTAMDDAARMAERDGAGAIPGILAATYNRLSEIVTTYEPGGSSAFRDIYWAGIGFVPPPDPLDALGPTPQANPAPPPPHSDKPPPSPDTLAVAMGVSLAVGVSVAAVAVVAVLLRRRSKYRTLTGKVVPPGLGPLTTLVVMDIQSSTTLWDTLPQDVMESSIALHHAVLRRVAQVHGGYESASEGESMVLGFHSPLSATRAAVQAQAELLAADWPAGLLCHPLCAPQYAVPAATSTAHAKKQSTSLPLLPLWGTETLSSLPRLEVDNAPGALQQSSVEHSWCHSLRQAWQSFGFTPRTNHTAGVAAPPRHKAVADAILTLNSSNPRANLGHDLLRLATTEGDLEISSPTSCSVAEYLSSLVTLSGQTRMGGSTLLYRGLRVRMGAHTGLTDESSVVENVQTGRLQYAGQPLAKATAVSNAGHGGMVLLTEDTFNQLDSASLVSKGLLLASMGSVQLNDVEEPLELYQALTHQLAYRTCFNPQLRFSQQLSPSFLDAPHDRVTVCFVNAVGLATLNAWSSTITQASIHVYHEVAASELSKHSGYLVNSSAGMFVAVFKEPASAIRWALITLQQCLQAEWHPALLEHELGEEVVVCHNETETLPSRVLMDVDEMGVDSGAHVQQDSGNKLCSTRGCASLDYARGSSVTRPSDHVMQSGSHAHSSHAHSSHVHSSHVHSSHVHSSHVHSSQHASSGSRRHQVLSHTVTRKTVLFRGLRLKCAVDVGQAKASIEPSVGRVMYFGRTMNRCSRVSAMTKTGQVWCTQDVWDLASPTLNSYEARGTEAGYYEDQYGALYDCSATAGAADRNVPLAYPAPVILNPRHASAGAIVASPQRAGAPLARCSGPSRHFPVAEDRATVSGPWRPSAVAADDRTTVSGGNTSKVARTPGLLDLSDAATHCPVQQTAPASAASKSVRFCRAKTTPLHLTDNEDGSTGPLLRSHTAPIAPIGPMRLSWEGARKPVSQAQRSEQLIKSSPLHVQTALQPRHMYMSSQQPDRHTWASNLMAELSSVAGSASCYEAGPETRSNAHMIVAGVPLGRCKLRGIQESVGLVHCRFDDQSVVQVAKPTRASTAVPSVPASADTLRHRRASAIVASAQAPGTAFRLVRPGGQASRLQVLMADSATGY